MNNNPTINRVVTCPKCGTKCKITEIPDSFPGNREWETAECPKCGYELDGKRTSGAFRVEILSEKS